MFYHQARFIYLFSLSQTIPFWLHSPFFSLQCSFPWLFPPYLSILVEMNLTLLFIGLFPPFFDINLLQFLLTMDSSCIVVSYIMIMMLQREEESVKFVLMLFESIILFIKIYFVKFYLINENKVVLGLFCFCLCSYVCFFCFFILIFFVVLHKCLDYCFHISLLSL